jgi:hypothetical protein
MVNWVNRAELCSGARFHDSHFPSRAEHGQILKEARVKRDVFGLGADPNNSCPRGSPDAELCGPALIRVRQCRASI